MKSRRFLATTMGGIVLGVGLVLTNYGLGVTPTRAVPPDNTNIGIIDKLNQILAAIASLVSAGTGNHTLRWDTNNPSASRFVTVFTGAVLDKNTGLVWEQAPDGTRRTWHQATADCVKKNVGGTVGWRLPSVIELKSIQDPSLAAPFVPASAFTIGGNPGVQLAGYWSSSTSLSTPTFAWLVGFVDDGDVLHSLKTVTSFYAWCVRGGGECGCVLKSGSIEHSVTVAG